MDANLSIQKYFVDEAGDGVLFNKKGQELLGTEGCSRFFMLGLLWIEDSASLIADLNSLRANLLNDPYFKGVPSMQVSERKTAFAFHAKDDVPEVRREVFALLSQRNDLHFSVVIRDKEKLLAYVRQRNQEDPAYRYNPNELYDYLVRRLFRDRLHKHDLYPIYFARRGNSDRTQALQDALDQSKQRFADKFHRPLAASKIAVLPVYPKDIPELQVVDYFLWSVQRLFEKAEDRYVSILAPSIRLVVDLDDHRTARYGCYYDKNHPLTYDTIKDRK